jgi:SAM-dependent methyltransferase
MPNSEEFAIQRDQTTVANRYPEIFHPARRLCTASGFTNPRVLSFGCATGLETYDLATTYFPASTIIGLDVSPKAISTAKAERSLADRIIYDISTPDTLAKYAPYHAIFAMSVLCRWPDLAKIADASSVFPYSRFVEIVTLLDQNLAPGGILVIYNANYDFKDTDLISRYQITLVPGIKTSGYVKHFDRQGKEIPVSCGTDVIFRKCPNTPSPSSHRVFRFIDMDGQPIGNLCNP